MRKCGVLVAIILSLSIIAGCSSQPQIKFATGKGGGVVVNVELARTSAEHARGLMFREYLNSNDGLLFVFDDAQSRTFWMKNTEIPLDIIFVSKDKIIVDLKENFQPCINDACEKFTSKPAMFVVEVNAGFVEKNDLKIGNNVFVKM